MVIEPFLIKFEGRTTGFKNEACSPAPHGRDKRGNRSRSSSQEWQVKKIFTSDTQSSVRKRVETQGLKRRLRQTSEGGEPESNLRDRAPISKKTRQKEEKGSLVDYDRKLKRIQMGGFLNWRHARRVMP